MSRLTRQALDCEGIEDERLRINESQARALRPLSRRQLLPFLFLTLIKVREGLRAGEGERTVEVVKYLG
jgi:hypothetical protein